MIINFLRVLLSYATLKIKYWVKSNISVRYDTTHNFKTAHAENIL